jgi:hypothetical protein
MERCSLLSWISLFMGDMDEGAIHPEERKYLSKKEIKNLVMGPTGVPTPRRTGRQIVGRNKT